MNSKMTSSENKEQDTDLFFQQETSPYQPDKIEVVRGPMPAFIRYMPHAIILWSVGYVLYQTESNYHQLYYRRFTGLMVRLQFDCREEKMASISINVLQLAVDKSCKRR